MRNYRSESVDRDSSKNHAGPGLSNFTRPVPFSSKPRARSSSVGPGLTPVDGYGGRTYRSPYNRDINMNYGSASSSSSSNRYGSYDRYGSGSSTGSKMSTSCYSALPSGSSTSSASRFNYSPGASTSSRFDKPPTRSSSYATGISSLADKSSTSRYGTGSSSSSGYKTSMSTSCYTPSSSYSRPKAVDYRSQTPSYSSSRDYRESSVTKYDRDSRSLSRLDSREPSTDRYDRKPAKKDEIDDAYSKIYDRYMKDRDNDRHSTQSAMTTSLISTPTRKTFAAGADVGDNDVMTSSLSSSKYVSIESAKEKQMRRSSGAGGSSRVSSLLAARKALSWTDTGNRSDPQSAVGSGAKEGTCDAARSDGCSFRVNNSSNPSEQNSLAARQNDEKIADPLVKDSSSYLTDTRPVPETKVVHTNFTDSAVVQAKIEIIPIISTSPLKPPLSTSPNRSKNVNNLTISSSSPPSSTNSSSTLLKRAQRRDRTLEMVNNKPTPALQVTEAADSTPKPPLLVVTQPSNPSTPVTTSSKMVWDKNHLAPENDSSGSEDEDEFEDEEEEEIDDDCEISVSLDMPRGDLYPVDPNVASTVSIYSDCDSEFELPFMQKDSRAASRGRVSLSEAVPPPAPVFTASVTFDDAMDDSFYPVSSRLEVDSLDSRPYLSPLSFDGDSGDSFVDSVEVGCTLTLVEQAALKNDVGDEDEDLDDEESYEYEEVEEEEEFYEDEEEEAEEEEAAGGKDGVEQGQEEEELEDEEEDEEYEDEEIEADVDMAASIYIPSIAADHPGPSRSPIERPKIEDKTFARKSTQNMQEEERKLTESKQAKERDETYRKNGTVLSIKDKFSAPLSVPEPDKITYKRSSRLEPKDDLPKRTYTLVKPVLDDNFGKQMEELRQQIKTGSTKLQNEIKQISQGMDSELGEQKLKSIKSQHEQVVVSSKSILTTAEEEKKRWIQQRELEAEKVKLKQETREKDKMLSTTSSKGQADSSSRGKGDSNVSHVPINPLVSGVKSANTAAGAVAGRRNSKTDHQMDTDVLDELIYDLATTKPSVPEGARKNEAGGVANKLKKALGPKSDEKPSESTEKDVKRVRKYSARRKTEEILPDAVSGQPVERRQRRHRNRLINGMADVDLLLGWDKENASFEHLEAFIQKQSFFQRSADTNGHAAVKSRRFKPQKVWISELKDIDKIYKASELRDIKLSAFE